MDTILSFTCRFSQPLEVAYSANIIVGHFGLQEQTVWELILAYRANSAQPPQPNREMLHWLFYFQHLTFPLSVFQPSVGTDPTFRHNLFTSNILNCSAECSSQQSCLYFKACVVSPSSIIGSINPGLHCQSILLFCWRF